MLSGKGTRYVGQARRALATFTGVHKSKIHTDALEHPKTSHFAECKPTAEVLIYLLICRTDTHASV